MPRYPLYVSERYDRDDDDDDAPEHLHRMGGNPVGLSTEQWPRFRGRPMQHAFTLDLQPLTLDVPAAKEARVLAVFVDSYYEMDVQSAEGVTVCWLSQAQVDAHPQTTPPDDFVPEKLPGLEQMDEEGDYYQIDGFTLEVGDPEDDDEGGDFGESFVGGTPAWSDEGEPDSLPEGAFVLQVMSYDFPVCRRDASLFVFETGGYLQAEDPEDDDAPPPWPEAIAGSSEIVVTDEAPAPDALQKWGGVPRGISDYDWPKRMSHILTWVPDPLPDDADYAALAVFGRLSKATNWDQGELTFYEVRAIYPDDLEQTDAEPPEVPEGVEVLEAKTLEFRPLPDGLGWRDLQERSFVGPRPAWRAPHHRSADQSIYDPVMQLTDALLPVSPGPGTLHLIGSGFPVWHPVPGTAQSSEERYEPQGTLYGRETSTAIVAGWELSLDDSVLPERVEALEKTLLAALAARGLGELTLFVPGDTTTDRHAEISGPLVFGEAVVWVEANEPDPGPVDPAKVEAAVAKLPALDGAFWREVLAFFDGAQPPEAPAAYLLSWGPLCYGALYAGVAATSEDTPVYRFIANQDMQQGWSSQGIDGEYLESVDFTSVMPVDLSPEHLKKAERLESPGFWLICRYD